MLNYVQLVQNTQQQLDCEMFLILTAPQKEYCARFTNSMSFAGLLSSFREPTHNAPHNVECHPGTSSTRPCALSHCRHNSVHGWNQRLQPQCCHSCSGTAIRCCCCCHGWLLSTHVRHARRVSIEPE